MTNIKQTERLYSQSYITYMGTYSVAILAFWLFQDITESKILNSWFIIFSIFTLSRVFITWKFNRSQHNKNIEFWMILFLITSVISGTMWGLTGFLFIPKGTLSLLDSVLYHGILILFVATLIAASIITYSASKIVYLSFSIPAIVPQCLMLIAQGDKYHSFLGGVVLAYAFVMFVISMYINRVFTECSKVETQNDFLKSTLKKNGIKVDLD